MIAKLGCQRLGQFCRPCGLPCISTSWEARLHALQVWRGYGQHPSRWHRAPCPQELATAAAWRPHALRGSQLGPAIATLMVRSQRSVHPVLGRGGCLCLERVLGIPVLSTHCRAEPLTPFQADGPLPATRLVGTGSPCLWHPPWVARPVSSSQQLGLSLRSQQLGLSLCSQWLSVSPAPSAGAAPQSWCSSGRRSCSSLGPGSPGQMERSGSGGDAGVVCFQGARASTRLQSQLGRCPARQLALEVETGSKQIRDNELLCEVLS